MKTITFNELRRIKDSLPHGSTRRIAAELGVSEETVRNYFGGVNQSAGTKCGIHIEPGPDGGIVILDDATILEKALVILGENSHKVASVAV
ncbi:MAG: DNA-binding protein [Dysgonamonadaceae bacterium]|jgi:predicted transcriptional regulator|nr:DNA-binding protein [Dysgonamonadaceae bacterium]